MSTTVTTIIKIPGSICQRLDVLATKENPEAIYNAIAGAWIEGQYDSTNKKHWTDWLEHRLTETISFDSELFSDYESYQEFIGEIIGIIIDNMSEFTDHFMKITPQMYMEMVDVEYFGVRGEVAWHYRGEVK